MYLRKYFWLNYVSVIGLFCLLVIGVLVNTIGMRWGLPRPMLYDIVLAEEEHTEEALQVLIDAEEGDTLSMVRDLQPWDSDPRPIGSISGGRGSSTVAAPGVDAHGETRRRELENRFLRGSFQPGLVAITDAFLHIRISSFDFFPDTFGYGIVYFFLCRIVLVFFDLFGFVTVTNELLFYLFDITRLGRLYLSLRIFNLLYSGLSALLVYMFSRLFVGRQFSFFNAIVYFLVPTTMLSNQVIGPHALGTFFCLAMLYFCVRILRGEEYSFYMFMCSLSAGLAFGADYPLIVYVALTGITYLSVINRQHLFLFSSRSRQIFFTLYFPLGLCCMVVGMYALHYSDLFIEEFHVYRGYLQTLRADFSHAKVYNWSFAESDIFAHAFNFFPLVARYLGWPYLILGIFGMCMVQRVRFFFFALFLVSFALYCIQPPHLIWVSFLTLVPLLIITTSYVCETLVRSHFLKTTILLICIVSMVPLGRSMAESKHFYYGQFDYSTGVQAGRWINKNIKEDSTIMLCNSPMIFSVPPFRVSQYRVVFGEGHGMDTKTAQQVVRVSPEYIVWSAKNPPAARSDGFRGYDIAATFLNEVDLNTVPFFKNRLYPAVNPVIVIYRRQDLLDRASSTDR